MGQAAAETEARILVTLLEAGSGNGPTMSDGKTLFHADHGSKAGNRLGEVMTSVHAPVSREFFGALIAHPRTEEACKFDVSTGVQPLCEDVRRNFPFAGILPKEYSGTVTLSTRAAEPLVPANEGIAFPLGISTGWSGATASACPATDDGERC